MYDYIFELRYFDERGKTREKINIEYIFEEFYSLLMLVENFNEETEKKSIQNNLMLFHMHNYIVIRLVTILEHFFWLIIKTVINEDKELRMKIQNEYVDVKFSDLEKYRDGRITSGRIYATTHSFQKFDHISKIMKKILRFDNTYNEQIKSKLESSVEFNTNCSKECYLQKVKISDLFYIRHELVHELSKKRLNIFYVYWAVEEIIIITQNIIRDIDKKSKKLTIFKIDGIIQAYGMRSGPLQTLQ